ncbi:MAG: MltA domain-containing protein [Alphaproteobacteria bacterium]|nr:MltA domain-containing protein [Alphaproteobacteria bacterium]OJV15795.1 MAG: hypothetical protein BGO27_07770 [Alphaproteobacteria bacterium 33-17]
MSKFLIIFFMLIISSCVTSKKKLEEPVLKHIKAYELKGFYDDEMKDFWIAYQKSCAKMINSKSNNKIYIGNKYYAGTSADWKEKCLLSQNVNNNYHDFLLANYNIYKVESTTRKHGLFTGYYEASLKGSIAPTQRYKYPLYKLPKDEKLRTMTRAEIESGGLKGNNLEFIWVDDNVDLFFMHIQGSGRIHMPDGTVTRVGYAGQNGYPYTAIGRILLDIKAISQKDLSAHTIRRWLKHNPEKADDVMDQNESYIFFREVNAIDGPIGAQSVELTPFRSLAVDRRYIPLGAPVWLDTDYPKELYKAGNRKIARMFMAQDTGGAIKGAIRGDVFFGYGSKAEMLASYMKSRGNYYVFIPNTVEVK